MCAHYVQARAYLECDPFRRTPVYCRNVRPMRPIGAMCFSIRRAALNGQTHVNDDVGLMGQFAVYAFVQPQVGFTQPSCDYFESMWLARQFPMFEGPLDSVCGYCIIGASD